MAGAGGAALWLGGTAAMVDGAGRWTAFRRIALPLVLPGIATTVVLCLVCSWNDYAFASTFSGPDSQTLPIVWRR